MKKFLFFSIVMGLFFSLLWTALSFAQSQNQDQGHSPERFIQDNDRDNDGQVSKDEFPGPDDHFSQFDADRSGYLDESELPKGPPPQNN